MASRQLAGVVCIKDMKLMQLTSGVVALLLVIISSSEWAEANELGERPLILLRFMSVE